MRQAINAWLDTLPVTRVGRHSQGTPAFLACGVTGFYVALITLLGAALLSGRSLLTAGVMAIVSALSFFVYTYVRMWITGYEQLVLLEHVWFAFACNALVLHWLHEPLLPYLDLMSVALCPFLAAGRVGCTLVGCCHGRPSTLGLRYPDDCARDGFARHLIGVRLFPVAALEAAGLLIVGAIALAALPRAESGKVFAWYLIAYSVMRFGLEGLRGDERPHLIGLSQARWMSIIEAGLAVILEADGRRTMAANIVAALLMVLVSALLYRQWRDRRHSLLALSHVAEVRDFIGQVTDDASCAPMTLPILRTTSRRVAIAVSTELTGAFRSLHLSLALPVERSDLPLLCELATRAVPDLIPGATGCTNDRVLHVVSPLPIHDTLLDDERLHARALTTYGSVVRRMQQGRPSRREKQGQEARMPPRASGATDSQSQTNVLQAGRSWYFADVVNRDR